MTHYISYKLLISRNNSELSVKILTFKIVPEPTILQDDLALHKTPITQRTPTCRSKNV